MLEILRSFFPGTPESLPQRGWSRCFTPPRLPLQKFSRML